MSDPAVTAAQPRYQRAEDCAWRVIDDQGAVISSSVLRVRVLNAVATRVWELCDGRTLDDIVAHVVAEFEVEEQQARGDVEAFLRDLGQRGMVRAEAG